MVVHKVAQLCSIQVPPAQLLQLANKHRTFLSKRFDRTPNGSRLHFASAMTQLGYADGANFTDGASYLEIASWIIQNGADSPKDLIELWKRMALNVFVSNTDDHLRNHGFLLTSRGWHLSPAFDLNPNEFGDGLTLALSEDSNAQNPDLLHEVAPFFGLSDSRAKELLATVKSAAAQWGTIATDLGISRSEQAEMANAFRWATP
jgi:serine/threonine-protein kinase HipA